MVMWLNIPTTLILCRRTTILETMAMYGSVHSITFPVLITTEAYDRNKCG